ncbi:MAG: flagellar hook-length control protein FliK [Bacillota bacterium]|nr:flagellar hook-length control protein FliK [Bacillota bacterium]
MGCEVLNICEVKTKTIKMEKKLNFVRENNDFKETFENVKKNNAKEINEDKIKKPKENDKIKVKNEKKIVKPIKDDETIVDDINADEMSKLKELLESLGIEVTDEVLAQLSLEFDFSSIDNILEFVNLVNSETQEPIDLKTIVDSLEVLKDLMKNLKREFNNNDKSETITNNRDIKKAFNDLLKKLSGKIETVKISEFKNEIKDSLKELTSLVNKVIISDLKTEVKVNEKDLPNVNLINDEVVKESDKTLDLNDKEMSINLKKDADTKAKKVIKLNDKNQPLLKDSLNDNRNLNLIKDSEQVKESFKNELNFKLLSKVNQMDKVFSQIKNNFTTKFDGKISEMKVLLNPKSLGKVELKMTIEKGNVIAEFKVESMIVKQALESNLQDLKNALSEKGYSLDELNVSVGDDNQENQNQNQNQKEQYYENIFDENENEQSDNEIDLIEESKMISVMRRRAISYLG